ncbi:transposase domain-containing protein [Burkholderia sp. MSMB1588]|uniref:transposase domain-containing protein n=1 Tax=Burkholderia sp. MSMB1588 TaxID=1636423 RepID=UPI001F5B8A77|nr:transposase domain-containing protein [Burkholderia sp. MSMB1588]
MHVAMCGRPLEVKESGQPSHVVGHRMIVQTCKANGIDPYRYLAWLFQHLPLAQTAGDYATLLPWNKPVEHR